MEHPWTFPSFPFCVPYTVGLLGKRVVEEGGSSSLTLCLTPIPLLYAALRAQLDMKFNTSCIIMILIGESLGSAWAGVL